MNHRQHAADARQAIAQAADALQTACTSLTLAFDLDHDSRAARLHARLSTDTVRLDLAVDELLELVEHLTTGQPATTRRAAPAAAPDPFDFDSDLQLPPTPPAPPV